MRKILFFALAALTFNQLSAQKSFKKNTLYAEIAGNGLALSANYERQLGNKPGLGLHIGIGLGGDEKPVIPLGAKYLFELSNQKSFIEAGIGVSLADFDFIDKYVPITNSNSPYRVGFFPSIGYRHHTPYGLMWRVNYTPFFFSHETRILFGGVSVGWRI